LGAVAETAARRRLPGGIVALGAVMVAMAFAGLLHTVVWRAPVVQQLLNRADDPAAAWLNTPSFTVLMLVYAATAALSAVGLFQLKRWSVWAYVAWCASMAVIVVHARMLEPGELATANAVLGAVGSALFLLPCPYIARHTRAKPAIS
jgi:uncharacterized membrane protein (DUF2068 family)